VYLPYIFKDWREYIRYIAYMVEENRAKHD